MYIENVVKALIKKYKTRDPFELAEALGINIMYKNLESLKGFYSYSKRNKYIVLNGNLSDIELRLIISHELGHHFLHLHLAKSLKFMKDYTLFSASKHEREANMFAAHLLISNDLLTRYLHYNYSLEQIAQTEGLFPELIKLKFNIL